MYTPYNINGNIKENRVFVFEFDETLTFWDYKNKQYVPRPYMHKLLSQLDDLGHISIYNKTANILDQIFISKYLYFVRDRHIHCKTPSTLMSEGYDVIHFTTAYCDKCHLSVKDGHLILSIKPHFNFMIEGEMDNELLVLKNYLKFKLTNTNGVRSKDIDFSDWNDRMLVDSKNIYKNCNKFCKY